MTEPAAPSADFSLVVVTWECAPALAALLASMSRHVPGAAELIVVDNASTDDPEAELGAWPGESRFIGRPDNAGYGAAANEGIAAARGEAVVLLNPDTEILDEGLGALAALALEHGGLAGPRVLNADGSPQPSASGPPVGPWPWIGAVAPGALQPSPLLRRTEPWRLRRTTPVAWLSGSCVAAPREALLSLGPFDPAIHLYGEDMDLGLRAARSGVGSWFCPDVCAIVHHGRASTSTRFPEGPERRIELARRAVVRRAYGARRERAAWLSRRLNLRLRVSAKRAAGRDGRRDRAALEATRAARRIPDLPAEPDSTR